MWTLNASWGWCEQSLQSTSRPVATEVVQAIADLAAITRWCDGREVALAGYMARHSPIPEKPIAKAGRSKKKAKRALKRNETKKETPKLGKALEQGKVSGEHLDVAGRGARQCRGRQAQGARRAHRRACRRRRGDERRGIRADDPGRAATHGRRRRQEPPRASAAGDPVQPPSRSDDGHDRVLGQARSAAGDEAAQPAEGPRGEAVRRQGARRLPVRPDGEERVPAGARSARPL